MNQGMRVPPEAGRGKEPDSLPESPGGSSPDSALILAQWKLHQNRKEMNLCCFELLNL